MEPDYKLSDNFLRKGTHSSRSRIATGFYNHTKQVADPDSRQSLATKWWAASSGVAERNVEEGWREKLATSEQVTIAVIPNAEMNQ